MSRARPASAPRPTPLHFRVRYGERELVGDRLGSELPAQVLMLHGAGGAHRGRMRPLREELAAHGIGSSAFDFVGHGETGGVLERTSLVDRTRQARAVIDELGLAAQGTLALLAASMGAHTAVRLTACYPIDRLVLVVPAMYATAAYRVRFDQGFSDIIRTPHSWRTADGWELLARYRGRLLVIAAERDAVIPREVIERYHAVATGAASRRLFTVAGASHLVFTELRERDPAAMARVVELIAGELRGG